MCICDSECTPLDGLVTNTQRETHTLTERAERARAHTHTRSGHGVLSSGKNGAFCLLNVIFSNRRSKVASKPKNLLHVKAKKKEGGARPVAWPSGVLLCPGIPANALHACVCVCVCVCVRVYTCNYTLSLSLSLSLSHTHTHTPKDLHARAGCVGLQKSKLSNFKYLVGSGLNIKIFSPKRCPGAGS